MWFTFKKLFSNIIIPLKALKVKNKNNNGLFEIRIINFDHVILVFASLPSITACLPDAARE